MRHHLGRRIVACALTACIGMNAAQFYPDAAALEISAGGFDPVTQDLQISFDLELSQPVTIEVWADGAKFGNIIENEELSGWNGPLHSKTPEEAAAQGASVDQLPPQEENPAEAPSDTPQDEGGLPQEDETASTPSRNTQTAAA